MNSFFLTKYNNKNNSLSNIFYIQYFFEIIDAYILLLPIAFIF